MERTEVLDMMGQLKLYGMKAAYDETLATALKRKHEPQRFVGDLLRAEISEKQARSIKYQLTIAKLPLAKDLEDFQFEGTPINQTLVNDLAGGVHSADVILNILARQRDPGPAATILTPDALRLRHAPIADCARYDSLREAS